MEKFLEKKCNAKVIESKVAARGVIELVLRLEMPFSFSAGQYVWVEIPHLKVADPVGNKKAFSICSAPNSQNTIAVVARESQSGFKQAWFGLRVGDDILIHGPFGSSFTVSDTAPKNIIMIAGGVGVAPFLSVIENISNQALSIPCTLVYLNDKEEATPFLPELEVFKNTIPSFNYRVLYEYFSWDFIKDRYAQLQGATEWWVSGSQGMVNHVYGELHKGGVLREAMVFENFYPNTKDNLDARQISEQMRSEGLLTQAIQNSTNHTIITDANGVILFANKAAEIITGYTQTEMLGNTPRLWGGMMQPEFYQEFWQKKLSGQSFEGEITNRRKNGELYYAIAHIAPIFNGQKEIIGYIGTEEDITHIKRQEEIIAQEKLKDEAILGSIGESVIATDYAGVVVFVNQATSEMLKKPATEILNKNLLDMVTLLTEAGERVLTENRPTKIALTQKKKIISSDYYILVGDQKIAVYITATPIILNDAVIGSIEVIRNISKEREIDKAKTEFVSLASHQLRTPLSAINWYAEMLLAGDAGALNPEQEKYLKEVYAGNQRMVELVNALLNVSRLDLGTFIIEPKLTNVVALAKSVLGELQVHIQEKQLCVKENFDLNMPEFAADEKLLRMIFQNLLSNAVKYTPSQGTVLVEALVMHQGGAYGGRVAPADSLAISVRDTGMGIPVAQQAKIFSKLFRADNVMETDTEGTGLGLYIVKSIVDQSGGQVWFQSEQNKGTELYVLFPLTGMQGKEGSKKLE